MATSARTENIVLAGAIVLGVALVVAASFLFDGQPAALPPTLFAIPMVLVLLRLGHLRWIGAIYLVIAITLGFLAAIYASLAALSVLGVPLCIFGCTGEDISASRWRVQIVGAVGGLVGALVPLIALLPLGRKLRDGTALTLMALALLVLALFGSIGFSQSLPGMTSQFFDPSAPYARLARNLVFVVPWELTFGAALAVLLRRHTPKARLR